MAAHFPTFLRSAGADTDTALFAGMLVGPAQVAGRLLEFGLLRQISPLLSARLAGLMHPIGAALLAATGAGAAYPFALLHGAGNGILTIAKGTLPLLFFGSKGYGARQGWLMMPARISQALAPFLFGLLLTAPSLRTMLLIVTGFTVAHSITLSAAALGLVTLPPAFVEPAIAASIAYVGIENFWRPAPKRRVAITFLLGLVHGFGFAGMLAELGLPRDALTIALLCFNGGVELGQGAVVLVTLPLLLWMRRWSWWEARAVPVASVGVTLAGRYGLVERLTS
jgi:hypothetical protein